MKCRHTKVFQDWISMFVKLGFSCSSQYLLLKNYKTSKVSLRSPHPNYIAIEKVRIS